MRAIDDLRIRGKLPVSLGLVSLVSIDVVAGADTRMARTVGSHARPMERTTARKLTPAEEF